LDYGGRCHKVNHFEKNKKPPGNKRMKEDTAWLDISFRITISVSMVEKHMSKAIRLLKRDLLTNCELLLVIVAVNKLL
jgi:hypothetical protein